MRGGKMLMAMLTAGSLTLGAGLALGATGESKAPEASKTPAVTTAPATQVEKEAKETKAEQQAEKARATQKKGEKEVAADRIVRGEVTAVEISAKTLTIKRMKGKEAETIGVEVPDTAKITEGKATKTLADIKVGDHVWVKYDRMSNKLEADHIRILKLKSAFKAVKSESSKKS
jgi:sRNA-binding protein